MALPYPALQKAPQQQEEREHHHRVKVDLAAAGDRGPGAGQPGQPDRQRHGQVHDQGALSQVAPGGGKKRAGGEQHHEAGDQQADPAQQPLVLASMPWISPACRAIGEHAHLHHAQAGDRQAAQFQAVFLLHLPALGAGLEGPDLVAERVQPGEDLAQGQAVGVEADVQPALLQVDQRRADAGKPCHGLLDQPGAGGAGDTTEQQSRCHLAAGGRIGEAGCQCRVVVDPVLLRRRQLPLTAGVRYKRCAAGRNCPGRWR